MEHLSFSLDIELILVYTNNSVLCTHEHPKGLGSQLYRILIGNGEYCLQLLNCSKSIFCISSKFLSLGLQYLLDNDCIGLLIIYLLTGELTDFGQIGQCQDKPNQQCKKTMKMENYSTNYYSIQQIQKSVPFLNIKM